MKCWLIFSPPEQVLPVWTEGEVTVPPGGDSGDVGHVTSQTRASM